MRLDFASLAAFDEHRVSQHEYLFSEDHPDGLRCKSRFEMEAEGWQQDPRGRWSSPKLIADAERVRTRFSTGDSSPVRRSGAPASV
jgi:hypothetical protein